MSREIFLYSKDKKYKCAVELADSCDHFGCPDNSVMILFEERKDGTYIIAQARDKRLETEKDRIIADLETKLALTEKALELAVADKCKFENALLSTSLGFINGKVAVPKKEQWYLEQAKESIKSE